MKNTAFIYDHRVDSHVFLIIWVVAWCASNESVSLFFPSWLKNIYYNDNIMITHPTGISLSIQYYYDNSSFIYHLSRDYSETRHMYHVDQVSSIIIAHSTSIIVYSTSVPTYIMWLCIYHMYSLCTLSAIVGNSQLIYSFETVYT